MTLPQGADLAPTSMAAAREGGAAPARRAWAALVLRHLALAAIACGYCVLVFTHGHGVPQNNDHEAGWTVAEAQAILSGRANWGLCEYTHHPIGRAYLLLPVVGLGDVPLYLVPVMVAAACAATALLVLLQQATSLMWRGFLVAFFLVLLWQPGFGSWLGNLHQHSYNMSSILLLVAVCGSVRRARWPLAAIGFACGWIGYDFIFLQVCAIAALRIAWWSRQTVLSFVAVLWHAGAETAAFAAAFLTAVVLHLAQNVLYFHSAAMAVTDLYGSLEGRVGGSLGERLAKAGALLGTYLSTFLAPQYGWSVPAALLGVAGLYLVALLHGALTWERREPAASVWRPTLSFALAVALALGSVPLWMFVAPRHAEPHLHLFPRLLLVPPIVLVASTILVLAPPLPAASAPRWTRGILPIVALLAAVGLNLLPPRLADAIDARWFDTIWNSPTAGLRRAGHIAAPLLEATAVASSTGNGADAGGPLRDKAQIALVGGIGNWGLPLDTGTRWFPADTEAFPHTFEQRFAATARVEDVALRFFGPPMNSGKNAPDRFTLLAVHADGSAEPLREFPGSDAAVTRQGKYLAVHYTFSPPVACDGLRLVIHSTMGGGVPVMTDFLAFGGAADAAR